MERNIVIWNRERLPYPEELFQMEAYDGLLIENVYESDVVEEWQKDILPDYNDMLHISFTSMKENIIWMKKINGDSYWLEYFDRYRI